MYKNDTIWRDIQTFLPTQNRLSADTMPRECYAPLNNGHRIHLDVYSSNEAKATIILLHGVGGNGRMLSFLAVPLYKCGYEVICPDLPLYGYSEYSGTVTYHSWVEDAVQIANDYVEKGRPVFLFGLSAGGMLAYQVACKIPSVYGVLATCILDQRQRKITEKTSSNPKLVRYMLPMVSVLSKWIPNFKIPMKWVANMKAIVNNEQLAKLLMSDRRSSGAKISLAFLRTMLSPQITIEPSNFTRPFCLLHPENDCWTDVSLSKLFYDKLGCEKELHILKSAGHFPIEEQGVNSLVQNSIGFIEKYRMGA